MKEFLFVRHMAVVTFCAWSIVLAQPEATPTPRIFVFQASYVGDVVNNFSGGLKAGLCYLGMANITASFDTKAGGLWANGSIFVKAANTHGARPSTTLTGDFQTMSNIDAGDLTYLQEVWYCHEFGPASLTVGLQDLNAKFAVNEYSGMYINSSFGIHCTISHNIPVSIFPLTSPGVTMTWNVSDRLSLLACVFEGNPVKFEDNNPYNVKWRFDSDDGVIAAGEAQLTIGEENNRHGIYKVGVYNHDHLKIFDTAVNAMSTVYTNNYGVYCTIDQAVVGKASSAGGITAFARASVSPKEIYNDNYAFFGGGVNYYGLRNEDGSDVLGVAFAHAILSTIENETVFEVTYQTPVVENITLQPDLQYIIHPVGSGTLVPNCFAGTVRFGVHF